MLTAARRTIHYRPRVAPQACACSRLSSQILSSLKPPFAPANPAIKKGRNTHLLLEWVTDPSVLLDGDTLYQAHDLYQGMTSVVPQPPPHTNCHSGERQLSPAKEARRGICFSESSSISVFIPEKGI